MIAYVYYIHMYCIHDFLLTILGLVKHHFEYVFQKDPELGYEVNNVKYVFQLCLHFICKGHVSQIKTESVHTVTLTIAFI